MIDFRYHLVSLIAVFLAVALGIVIGTTQLNGGVLDNLQTQVSGLQEDKRVLESQAQQLQGQLDDANGFDEAVGPILVQNTLTDRSVVLVIGGTDVPADVVEGVTALLGTAGATVTGSIRLNPGYGDPQRAADVQSYVTGQGMPPGLTLPVTGDTGRLVASVLAQVLMIPGAGDAAGGTAPSRTATASVLAGLEQLDLLSPDTSSVSPADFAVVLTAGVPTDTAAADTRNAALVQLAAALDARGSGAVVAGDSDSATDGGLVAAVRADRTVSTDVSTVDNVDAPAGRVSTVLALAAEGRNYSGAYGTGANTQLVPLPAS